MLLTGNEQDDVEELLSTTKSFGEICLNLSRSGNRMSSLGTYICGKGSEGFLYTSAMRCALKGFLPS